LLALEYNETLKRLYFELSQQQFLIQQCKHGFFLNEVLQHKKNYTAPYFTVNIYAKDNKQNIHNVSHADLFKQLKALRDSICDQKKLPIYLVASGTSLYEMAEYLPLTLQDLKKISGFGHVKCEQYGLLFLDIIQRYCNEHNLETQINQLNIYTSHKKPGKVQSKKEANTKLMSLQLFQQGLSIATIAKERNLTEATIYKHLAHYVEEGSLPISNFLSEEKLSTILLGIQTQSENLTLANIKQKLPGNYSYSDIQMAMAHKHFMEKTNTIS
jgi:ATP-dependent DNA helicase RecQ